MTTYIGEGKSLGRIAFEAYRSAAESKTFDGKKIPEWDDLHGDKSQVQAQWEAAASAVAALVTNGRGHSFPDHQVPPPLPRV